MEKKQEITEITAITDIDQLLAASVELIIYARSLAARQVNIIQLMTYHTLGRWIVEVEQGGKNRAEYGKQVLKRLSERLNEEFGKGFSLSNLKNARQFYLTYKDRISQTLFVQFAIKKSQTVFGELEKTPPFTIPWSHYLQLMRIKDDKVDYIEVSEIRWDSLRFQKNNQEYRMLLNICNLVLQGLLLSTDTGEVKMATFLDEQRMCRLYEKFILEYYRHHHPELNANPDRIDWDTDKDKLDLLPVMQTDITLKKNGRVLIIDAKYYAHNLQTQYDTQTIHSANLYQIFTYVKNLDKDNTGNVAGMLLYARTQDQIQPNNTYRMGVNQISVQTLDLNLPFTAIAEQLEKIVEDYFSSEEKRQVEVQYGY